jgi:hypothetical protein
MMMRAIPILVLMYGLNAIGVCIGKIKYKMKTQNNKISKGEMEFKDGNFIILIYEKIYSSYDEKCLI